LSINDINFDRVSFGGRTILQKRMFETIKDHTFIMIQVGEFLGFNDHMNRVNYLISNGVENQNSSGIYDFTDIKLESKEGDAEAADVAVEEGEEAVDVPVEGDAIEEEVSKK